MRVSYTGHEALTFTDYIDLEAGKTLHAVPGGTYDIAPASGHVVPELPEPWFVLVQGGTPGEGTPAEGEGVPWGDPEASPAPEDEHGDGEG